MGKFVVAMVAVLLPQAVMAQSLPFVRSQAVAFNDKYGNVAGFTVTKGNRTSAYSLDGVLWGTAIEHRNGAWTHYDERNRYYRVREVVREAAR